MGRRLVGATTFLVALLSSGWDPAESRPAAPEAAGRTAPEATGRAVRVEGTQLIDAAGRPFEWRGITAFALLDQVADGREAEAIRFMRWASESGFNVVRVLTMASVLFELSPADGAATVSRLLRLAADLRLVVELVAFADTSRIEVDFAAHLDRLAQAIGDAPNVVVELANENRHRAQDRRLTDPDFLRALRARLPADLPVSLGSIHGGDMRVGQYGGGDYLTIHVTRALEPWEHVSATARVAALAREAGRPVVSDEPIGAGEQVERRRRWTAPSIFFGLGLMGRMSDVPTTFHCSDCLHATVPSPKQRAAAAAFVEGARVLPAGRRFTLAPIDRVLVTATVPGVTAMHAAQDEAGEWMVVAALGVSGRPELPWATGWRAEVLASKPGIVAYRLRRPAGDPAGGNR